MTYKPEIDGLRAIAVLSVFLFHLGLTSFSGGYVGVDVFFVISGFLITSIIQKDLDTESFSIKKFYDRRFRRIMPALYLVLIFTTVFTWFFFMPQEMKAYCKSLLGSLLFYSNFFFWDESGYFDLDSGMKPLLHTWSLSIEEQFYIFYPTLLFLIHKYFKSKKITILSALFLISFALNIWTTKKDLNDAFYFTHVRIWELLLGALLSLKAFPQTNSKIFKESLSWIGMVMLGVSIFKFTEETKFPGWAAILPCFGTAFLIYASQTVYKPSAAKILGTNLMTGIGKISYSLYLWHWPAIVFAKYYLMRDLVWTDRLGIATGATIVAYLSWKYVEQPFRTRQGIFKDGEKLFRVLLACTVVFCFFAYKGAYRYRNVGYQKRMDQSVLKYAMAYRDTNPSRVHCHTMPTGNFELKNKLCTMGQKTSFKPQMQFFAWGDSFADAMMQGLQEMTLKNKAYGLFASSSACSPVLGIKRQVGRLQLDCDRFNRQVLEQIQSNNIKDVLLISEWAVSGYDFIDQKTSTSISFKSEKYTDYDMERYYYGVRSLFEKLQSMGVKIWVIDQIPYPGFNVPSYLARYEYLHRDKKKLEMTYDKFIYERSSIRDIFDHLSQEVDFKIIDPSTMLCKDTCMLEMNGVPLYHDEQHLSKTGSKFVSPVFQPFFDSLKKKN